MRRITGGQGELDRVFDVLGLVVCAFLAAVISAAFGPMSLYLGDVIAADELARVFRTWTLGDAAGVLVLAPAILTWSASGLKDLRRRDLVELVVMLAVLVVLAEVPPQQDVPYIVFPVLLADALRLGLAAPPPRILVVCSITVWNTAQSEGPFVRESITDSLLATQFFIAISAITSLILAAVTAERRGARRARWRPPRRLSARSPTSRRHCAGSPRSLRARRRRAASSSTSPRRSAGCWHSPPRA